MKSKRENAHHGVLLKCKAELAIAPTEEETENGVAPTEVETEKGEELSRATLIWRAIKLPMYTVALIPVTVSMHCFILYTFLNYEVLYVLFGNNVFFTHV